MTADSFSSDRSVASVAATGAATDRELLELAAKAAGINEYTYCELVGGSLALYCKSAPLGIWAPLTDDGDALRLAVKLRLTIYGPEVTATGTWSIVASKPDQPWDDVEEKVQGDECAATRRAIVRAAAEIGKSPGSQADTAGPDQMIPNPEPLQARRKPK